MKWLITGGAGFIGSHFVKYALRKGVQVVNVDALTYAGHLENLREVEALAQPQGLFQRGRAYEFVHADISDEEAMRAVFRRHPNINAIVNFAAESHVDRSLQTPDVFLKSNILGTRVLLELARESRARFLQVSTDEVYGSLGDSGAFTENSPIQPSSPYSASKAAADLIVQAYVRTHGVDGVITRCSNNFGPFQDPEKLIPMAIIKALRGERVPIYGDGKNVRDWLHVSDHCVAIDFALWYGRAGEIYNVGGGNESSNLETVAILLDELKADPDLIEFVADRPGHDRRYAIDASKMRALGWRPQTVFETELRNTARWYVEHRDWWEAILSGDRQSANEPEAALPVEIASEIGSEASEMAAPVAPEPIDEASIEDEQTDDFETDAGRCEDEALDALDSLAEAQESETPSDENEDAPEEPIVLDFETLPDDETAPAPTPAAVFDDDLILTGGIEPAPTDRVATTPVEPETIVEIPMLFGHDGSEEEPEFPK